MADRDYDNLLSIIGGAIRKDERAQELLYKQYFGYALSVALLYSANRDDALEIVNDSFMKVFQELKRFDTSKSFKSWMRRIVINTSIDKVRKNTKHAGAENIEGIVEKDSSPGVISHLTVKEIIALLNNLPHIYKTIFCLFDIEGYSHQEISKRLKIPESTSRVYLVRARAKMKELYLKHIDSAAIGEKERDEREFKRGVGTLY